MPQRNMSVDSGTRAVASGTQPLSSNDAVGNARRFRNRYRLAIGIPASGVDLVAHDAEITVDSPLAGSHQQRNIALALAAATALCHRNGYSLTPSQIELGLRRTHWPARLELISTASASVLFDVAHNPAGAWALRSALSALPESPRTLIFGCLQDKPIAEMMQILFPLFDSEDSAANPQRILLTPADSQRAAPLDDLIAAAAALGYPAEAIPSPADALTRALAITPPNGLIIVTGSLYLVGALRAQLLGNAGGE